ncbi:NusG domain II-containing protein [Lactiplantibacillus garii]|uniref:NusG domain II-containing protein n=1 Tax=Lactiplantibacillus garii TaxID=2306423 RepID=A0A3R8KH24_9LACO|nr:NusG domain II-containing protein [Lactiplantibacillus garii]RRK11733.1 NusG domain II-containing protein [Lactiplantibacillus garii]
MKKLRATVDVLKRYGGMIRPFDIIIIIALIILSFTPIVIFSYQQKQQAQRAEQVAKQRAQKRRTDYTAVVSHNGTVLKRVNLTTLSKTTHYTYRAKDGDYNTVTFKPHKVAITKANCSDQVCIRRGWITKPGQTIVCLPHKVLIEIKSDSGHVKSGGNGLVTE